MFQHLDQYVLRRIIVPLSMTLLVAAMLLLLERMLRLFDFVVNNNGPVDVVWQMLLLLVPHYVGLALPLGLFLGVVLAFRRLSLSSELDAIISSGIGLPRLLKPILMLSVLLMIIHGALTFYVQPHSRYAYRDLSFDLRSGAMGASIRVGAFVEIAEDVALRIEESRDEGREMIDIFLQRTFDDGRQIAVTAKRGGFLATDDDQTIILRLIDGRLVELRAEADRPRILTFDVQDLILNLPEIEEFRPRGDEHREMTFSELLGHMAAGPEDPLYQEVRASFHWRSVMMASFLVLPLLGIAAGLANKRTGSAAGLVVGIALVIVYHELLEVGERIAASGTLSPWVSMWGLFAAFGAMSLYMFRVAAFHPGGEPLGWVEWLWQAIKSPFLRFAHWLEEAI